MLVFMLADEAQWPERFDERERDAELRHWRQQWSEAKGVGFFGAEPSSIEIAPALTRWIAENTIGVRAEAVARLATKVSEEVVRFLLAIQMAERGALPSQQAYDDAYRRWEQAVAEIAGDLHALGTDDALQAAWRRLAAAVLGLYRLSGTWSEPWRGKLLEELQSLFLPEATDWSELADAQAKRASNAAFQRHFAAWWKLRELLLSGCAEFGRRLRAGA